MSLMCRNPSSGPFISVIPFGAIFSSTSCGTVTTHASARTSVPSSRTAAEKRPSLIRISRMRLRRFTSPPHRTMAARQPSYKSREGRKGCPRDSRRDLPKKPSRKHQSRSEHPFAPIPRRGRLPAQPARIARSLPGLILAVKPVEHRNSLHARRRPPGRAMVRSAFAMPRLSASVRAEKNRNAGAMCNGGGKIEL